MRGKALLTTAALAAIFVLAVPATAGSTYYFTAAADNDWHNSNNWKTACSSGSAGAVPTEADRAVICGSALCNISTADAVADTLVVESGATLNVVSRTLTLDDDNGPAGNHLIDGTVNLTTSTSVLEFIDGSSNLHVVSYTGTRGTIAGAHNQARIQIGTANLTVRSEVIVSGALEIRAGSGTFENDWIVEANHYTANNTTLTLYSGTFANGSGTYKVSTDSASVLAIDTTGATSMSANFNVSNGRLDVNQTAGTSGNLTQTGGIIGVAANRSSTAGS